MKIVKKAEQKNVKVNKGYYTLVQINDLLLNNKVFYFDDCYNSCKDKLDIVTADNTVLRIYTEDIDSLEVVLDEYGSYTTMAYLKNSSKIFVKL